MAYMAASPGERPAERPVYRIVTTLIWLAAVAGVLVYACWFRVGDAPLLGAWWEGTAADPRSPLLDRRLIGLLSEHWMLFGLIAMVVLMIGGRLGVSVGLPGLFRDPPPARFGNRRGWGRIGEYAGPWSALVHSGAFWGTFGATVLVALVWTAIYYADHINHPDGWDFGEPLRNHSDLFWFLALTCPPFLLLLVVAILLPAVSGLVRRRGWLYGNEVARHALGMAFGAVIVIGLILLGSVLHGLPVLAGLERALRDGRLAVILRAFRTLQDRPQDAATLMVSYSLFLLMIVLYLLAFGELRGLKRYLTSGHALCILCGIGVAVYSLLVALAAEWQLPVVLVVLAYFIFANRSPYKYRFPGMDDDYRQPVEIRKLPPQPAGDGVPRLENVSVLDAWWRHTARLRLLYVDHPLTGRDGTVLSIEERRRAAAFEAVEPLRAWWREHGLARPRLVVAAVTGAAYRSAFWTGTVLDTLCRELPEFGPSVRLITGASGGIVGAAYHVVLVSPEGCPTPGVVERLRAESRLDSLSPVVQRLLRRDLPRGFWPFPQEYDRGVELERQWRLLDRTFDELRAGEEAGWRPSLIVSPMSLESGRRVLFSNLDLRNLTAITPADGGPPYSIMAVDFFRIFPRSYPTFRLQTAVRMNATFPYISPAVSLPTDPPRRVVDAGYYDNYGVDLACSWAYEHRDWLREHTSGLALLQIRAYPSEARRKELYDPDAMVTWHRENLIQSVLRWPGTAAEFLTAPLEAAGSARAWSMSFRNDEEIRGLDDLFNRQDQPRRFFRTFVFENPLDFAMNWLLSDDDLAEMAFCIGAPAADQTPLPRDRLTRLERISESNRHAKAELWDWWRS